MEVRKDSAGVSVFHIIVGIKLWKPTSAGYFVSVSALLRLAWNH